MADHRRCCSIRCRTDTCFIGIQSSADALHHSRSGKSGKNCLKVKCFFKDLCKNCRKLTNVQYYDQQRHQNVHDSHKWNQCRGYFHNSVTTAKQTPSSYQCQHTSYDPRGYLCIIKRHSCKSRLQIVRRQHIKSKGIGQNHGDTESNCQSSAMQSCFDIISRSAIAFPIFALFLVDLCQSTLCQCRCASNNGNHPHPEYRAHTTDTDGR